VVAPAPHTSVRYTIIGENERHMKTYILFPLGVVLLILFSCSKSDISVDKAIQIAVTEAEKNHFDTKISDVEVLKVKKGIERGPIRIVSIMRYFPKERMKIILDNDYWIIFFYPKGNLDHPHILGGEYTVLVELHTGNILASYAGM